MDPYWIKRLWRRPWLSLCSLVLSAVLCFLLGYLASYREDQQSKLEQTKQQYDILCVVTDRRGTKSTGLRMDAQVEELLLDESETGMAQFVRDLRITKEFTYSAPALGIPSSADAQLIGVNNECCSLLLDPARDARVIYLTENFYDQSEYLCLVSEKLYNTLEGDTLTVKVTDPFIDFAVGVLGVGELELQVAGFYAGTDSTIFISYGASQRLADKISAGLRSSDSVSFLAADNERLDEIYSVAAKIFGTVDPKAGDDSMPNVALTVHDKQYRATVAALEQNIQRTGFLLPVLFLLALGMGFLISLLFTRNESKTYALMRTMGMTRGKLFGSIIREQLVLVGLAALVMLPLTRELLLTLIYFVCYAIGCVVCVIRAIRISPTAILREQE